MSGKDNTVSFEKKLAFRSAKWFDNEFANNRIYLHALEKFNVHKYHQKETKFNFIGKDL